MHPLAFFASSEEYAFATAEMASASPAVLTLEKFWHVVLFLLSREYRERQPSPVWLYEYEDPLSWAVVGAHIGSSPHDADMGAPFRYSAPTDVRAIARSLNAVNLDEFMRPAQEADDAELNELYGSEYRPASPEDTRYASLLHNLKTFYTTASEREDAVFYEYG